MKSRLLFLGVFVLIGNVMFAQGMESYNVFIAQADSLYKIKQFQASAAAYKSAFDQLDGKAVPVHRYNAACSYALSNDTENAFY
ncbi:MAG: hypothetical protein AAFV07_07330, partial [Bacteroidota bacterium]